MKKLNIYFTAGIPKLNDTAAIAEIIQNAGADMMEIGIPYSDPVADGNTIQKAHKLALENGMNLALLFEQLESIKHSVQIPKILMGYLNPILQFGFENFCKRCSEVGIAGLIIPDLPPVEFVANYQSILQQYGLSFSFLVTPETTDERIKYLDSLSSGFLYAVSSSSTTGNQQKNVYNQPYLEHLHSLGLNNPILVGFGIKNKTDFAAVTKYANGGIIGTAFVNILINEKDWQNNAYDFIKNIKN